MKHPKESLSTYLFMHAASGLVIAGAVGMTLMDIVSDPEPTILKACPERGVILSLKDRWTVDTYHVETRDGPVYFSTFVDKDAAELQYEASLRGFCPSIDIPEFNVLEF